MKNPTRSHNYLLKEMCVADTGSNLLDPSTKGPLETTTQRVHPRRYLERPPQSHSTDVPSQYGIMSDVSVDSPTASFRQVSSTMYDDQRSTVCDVLGLVVLVYGTSPTYVTTSTCVVFVTYDVFDDSLVRSWFSCLTKEGVIVRSTEMTFSNCIIVGRFLFLDVPG